MSLRQIRVLAIVCLVLACVLAFVPAVRSAEPPASRAGTWNLRVTRDPAVVRREVAAAVRGHGLDWLAVQEAHAYVDALARIRGTRLVVFRRDRSAADAAIVVRRGVPVSGARLVRLSSVGWPRPHGAGWHWPRSAPVARVAGVTVASVHMPPGGPGGFAARAYRQCARSLVRLGRAVRGPLVLAGDWNARAGSRARFAARWVAQRVGGRVTGSRIDLVVSRGVPVSRFHRSHEGSSDHLLALFRVG